MSNEAVQQGKVMRIKKGWLEFAKQQRLQDAPYKEGDVVVVALATNQGALVSDMVKARTYINGDFLEPVATEESIRILTKWIELKERQLDELDKQREQTLTEAIAIQNYLREMGVPYDSSGRW